MNEIIAYKNSDGTYSDINTSGSLPIKKLTEDAQNIMRHDMAHIMAEAVISLFPKAEPTIGPFIKNGFYYDFDIERNLNEEDIVKIENKMKEILKETRSFKKKSIDKEKALELFKNNKYKLELIKNISDEELTIYEQENFIDLCKGPHHSSTKEYSPHFKIINISGAYWRGISTNKMLQRIYATAWFSKKELDTHIKNIEEAKERNHRRLGTDMGLFLLSEFSAGNVFWKANGLTLYNNITNYIRDEQRKLNYFV